MLQAGVPQCFAWQAGHAAPIHVMSAIWLRNQEALTGLLMCHSRRSLGLQDLSGNVELVLAAADLEVLSRLPLLRTLQLPKPHPLHGFARNPAADDEALLRRLPDLQIYRTYFSG